MGKNDKDLPEIVINMMCVENRGKIPMAIIPVNVPACLALFNFIILTKFLCLGFARCIMAYCNLLFYIIRVTYYE